MCKRTLSNVHRDVYMGRRINSGCVHNSYSTRTVHVQYSKWLGCVLSVYSGGCRDASQIRKARAVLGVDHGSLPKRRLEGANAAGADGTRRRVEAIV